MISNITESVGREYCQSVSLPVYHHELDCQIKNLFYILCQSHLCKNTCAARNLFQVSTTHNGDRVPGDRVPGETECPGRLSARETECPGDRVPGETECPGRLSARGDRVPGETECPGDRVPVENRISLL